MSMSMAAVCVLGGGHTAADVTAALSGRFHLDPGAVPPGMSLPDDQPRGPGRVGVQVFGDHVFGGTPLPFDVLVAKLRAATL